MKAVKGKEIMLVADNKVGQLEAITSPLKEAGINIRAVSAWAVEDKAYFRFITSDNSKAKDILQNIGSIEEKEVIIADMPDEVGQLQSFASKLKDADIDITYIYGTTSEPGGSAIIVFSSSDNDKVLELISG
ncbi:MAG: ACT domain-containing protein [Candidatus Omnitrophica bacterium]|nr:ACT domain-containing protein [Candidatus Omnitrophota bacterium]MBD3268914.1 ACT domain-containing protein [Candidatus Omnitrophota bacterium]